MYRCSVICILTYHGRFLKRIIVKSKRTFKLEISLIGDMLSIIAGVSPTNLQSGGDLARIRQTRCTFTVSQYISLSPFLCLFFFLDENVFTIKQACTSRKGQTVAVVLVLARLSRCNGASCSFLEASPQVDASWKPNTMYFHACLT